MVEDLSDPRRAEPPYLLSERDMLEQWLEFHRTTLLLKCEGLDDAGRKRRPVPTSMLSLHGLIRHMIDTERSWFRRTLLCEADAPWVFRDDSYDDRELDNLDDADWDDDVASWLAECDASRAAAASRELDDTGLRHGEPCSLRWIYVHMIEEYARHNGHADLMRELIDGRVGWWSDRVRNIAAHVSLDAAHRPRPVPRGRRDPAPTRAAGPPRRGRRFG